LGRGGRLAKYFRGLSKGYLLVHKARKKVLFVGLHVESQQIPSGIEAMRFT
jgi:hypothetical protein